MRLPRDLSGDEVVRLLVRHFEYQIIRTRGSHVTVRRETSSDPSHSVTVPQHRNLKVGTLDAIVSDVAMDLGLPKAEVRDTLFN